MHRFHFFLASAFLGLAMSPAAFAQNPLRCVPATNLAPPSDANVSALMDEALSFAKPAVPFEPFDAKALDSIPAEAAGSFQDLGNGMIRIARTRIVTQHVGSERQHGDRVLQEETAKNVEITECFDIPKASFVTEMNKLEKRLNDAGTSVRQAGDVVLSEIPTDTEKLRNQLLNELRMQGQGVVERIKDPLIGTACPKLSLHDLSPDLRSRSITLPDGSRLSYSNVLDRIQDSQSALCALGYSLLDGVDASLLSHPEDAVQRLLSQRGVVLDQLGISQLAPGMSLDAFRSLGDIRSLETAANAAAAAAQKIGPEMINDLKRQLAISVPPALQIPAMPDFKLPGPPKRTPLNVKKKKTWDGLNMGERSIVAISGKAELIIGGSEVDQTFRATGDASLFIFGNEASLLDALGEMEAGKKGVRAHLHVKIVGKDLFPPIDEPLSEKIVLEKLDALKLSHSVSYSQTFQIGPIPVAIKAGGFYAIGLGYRLALINTSAEGAVVPYAKVAGFAECGIGFSGFLSAGAGAEITLINLSAPLTGGAELRFDPEGYPYVRTYINSDAEFEILNGRIYGYVEFPIPFEIKKETMDIYKFRGPHWKQKIMGWTMDITHRGVVMSGDTVDDADKAEAGTIEEAISLDNRKEDLARRRKELKAYADKVFHTIAEDAQSDAQKTMIVLGQLAKEQRAVFDKASQDLGDSVIPPEEPSH